MSKKCTLAMLFMASCVSNAPSRLDIEADRARWQAVRAATADGKIDEIEDPLMADLLAAWDDKLSAEEGALQRDPRAQFEELLRVYGDAIVQTFAADELARAEKRYPEAFRLVDRDGDRVITIAELRAVDPTSPVFAFVVASTIKRLLNK